jgi:LysR family transcriptional regulator, nitrogen assimilation regulatory protein
MDLRQLRYFVGVVQAGSVSRAADQLHVAQSAISHHLASLESELDRQLVTRGPKGITLTEAGSVLYRHAEAILRHVEFAKQDAIKALNVPSGGVSIGIPSVLVPLLSYELFSRVRSTYPQIQLYVSEANGWLLRERLINGRLDIAVLFVGAAERGIAVEPLVLEELFFVTADPDPSPIRIADAAQHALLLAAAGSNSRRVIQEAFDKHGLTVKAAAEMDTIGPLRRAVAAGIGASIMPWSALHDGEGKITLNYRRFEDASLVRPVSLCFSDVGQRSPAIDAVALVLKSLVRELVESGTWQGVSLIAAPEELSPSLAPSRNSELNAL